AYTFSVRQSSLVGDGLPSAISIGSACGHDAPNVVAARSAVHLSTGWGARQRRSPTGGLAYGMPLKVTMPLSATPTTGPASVTTRAASAPWRVVTATQHAAVRAMRAVGRIMVIPVR